MDSSLTCAAYIPRYLLLLRLRRPQNRTLFPYTTLFRSITVEDYVSSRYILNPLRIWDCDRPVNASAAYLISGERSEEHTSELQSLTNLVCRLLLEKKTDTDRGLLGS